MSRERGERRPANSGLSSSMPVSRMAIVTPCPVWPRFQAVAALCSSGPSDRRNSAVLKAGDTDARGGIPVVGVGVGVGLGAGVGVGAGAGGGAGGGETLPPPPPQATTSRSGSHAQHRKRRFTVRRRSRSILILFRTNPDRECAVPAASQDKVR